jgi:hypothetical protein
MSVPVFMRTPAPEMVPDKVFEPDIGVSNVQLPFKTM